MNRPKKPISKKSTKKSAKKPTKKGTEKAAKETGKKPAKKSAKKPRKTTKAPDQPHSNVIPWRWSTKPKIDSDDPAHQERIREDPRDLAEDLIMTVCIARASRGKPLGIYEHLDIDDIESIVVRGDEITINLIDQDEE